MTDPVPTLPEPGELELVDQDILDAMRRLPGYVDISTDDFRRLYHLAYHHAAERIAGIGAPAEQTMRALEPPRIGAAEILRAWLGAFLAIAAVMIINAAYFSGTDLTLLNGSFGASTALLFGASRSPFSQPRNVLGGYVLSALVGVTCARMLGAQPMLAAALAVSTALALMHATRTLHPPAAGLALTAVIGSAEIHRAGYLYVLTPSTAGPLVLLLVAIVFHRIARSPRYPELWF